MLKAVIFDIDGVLVDSQAAGVARFQSLLVAAGYPKPTSDEVKACFHLTMDRTLRKLAGTADQAELRRIRELGRDPKFHYPDLWRFPPELEQILERLRAKYKLGIVTSRSKRGVGDIFEKKAIGHLFDTVVALEDYDEPKPDPEPLAVAAKRLGVAPEEAVYVGDSDTDIEAAAAANMKSIHLSAGKHPDAHASIREFAELADVLEVMLAGGDILKGS